MYYLWLVAPWESSIHKQAHVHTYDGNRSRQVLSQNGYGYMCIYVYIYVYIHIHVCRSMVSVYIYINMWMWYAHTHIYIYYTPSIHMHIVYCIVFLPLLTIFRRCVPYIVYIYVYVYLCLHHFACAFMYTYSNMCGHWLRRALCL